MTLPTRLVLVATLLSGPAASPTHWYEDGHQGRQHAKHATADCRFVPADVRVIRDYYAPRSRELPPGLQKKLYRTGHLPPGWEKKIEPFPEAVEHRLIALPPGYRRGFLSGYAVIYDPRTLVILDVVAVIG